MMRIVFASAVCFLSAYVAADDVVVGSSNNFDALLESKYLLAEFYAPWCGHCKNLEPEYSRAATTLKNINGLVVAKVDATAERALGEKYAVDGYPTLKWFASGVESSYTGGRDHDSIVAWVHKKTGDISRTLSNQASLDKFAKEGDAVLVGLFGKGDDAAKAEFMKAAASLDDILVGTTDDEDVIVKYAPAKVIMLQNFDDKRASYTGELTASAIQEFAVANALPVVIEFTTANQGKIFHESSPKRHLLALHNAGLTDDAKRAFTGELIRVAREFRGKLLVITVEKTYDNEGVFNFFGVSDASNVRLVVSEQTKAGMKKYFYDGQMGENSHTAIQAWISDITSGKVSPTLKSEEVPAKNDGPVKVIVGKTFKAEVVESSKSVFVELYAPWCGHCKALAPEIEKLGQAFKGDSNVVIAKMDATANEVSDVEISGFPSLYFFKAGSSTGVKYEGERTVAAMSAFITEKSGKARDDL